MNSMVPEGHPSISKIGPDTGFGIEKYWMISF